MKYTFSEEDEGDSDSIQARRSNRHSGISTPAEPAGPVFTASGRQVRSRVGGGYGQSLLNGQHENDAIPANGGAEGGPSGEGQQYIDDRPQRTGLRNGVGRNARRSHNKDYRSYDGTGDDSDAQSSGEEWDGGDDEEDDVDEEHMPEDDDDDDDDVDGDLEMSEDEIGSTKVLNHWDDEKQRHGSLVVSLKYQRKPSPQPPGEVSNLQDIPNPNKAPDQMSPMERPIPSEQPQLQRHPEKAFQDSNSYPPDQKPLEEPLRSNTSENNIPTKELPQEMDHPAYDRPMPDAAPA